MKNYSSLGALAFAMMAASTLEHENKFTGKRPKRKDSREYIEPIEPKEVIPKGCKKFHFSEDGTQVTESYTRIYFSCIASREKVAIKKLDKFNNKNNGNG